MLIGHPNQRLDSCNLDLPLPQRQRQLDDAMETFQFNMSTSQLAIGKCSFYSIRVLVVDATVPLATKVPQQSPQPMFPLVSSKSLRRQKSQAQNWRRKGERAVGTSQSQVRYFPSAPTRPT